MNNKANIIILDDDEDIGSMLKMMLEFKGYNAVLVDRVEKLNEALANNNYQLLVLDMLIAGQNGCDLCRELKKNASLTPMPILMFSALTDGRRLALEAGADDFVAKPFQMHDMFEKVDGMIKK